MAVDFSVILLFLYCIFSGTLGSPDLLPSYSITTIVFHTTIILIITLKSFIFQPTPKSSDTGTRGGGASTPIEISDERLEMLLEQALTQSERDAQEMSKKRGVKKGEDDDISTFGKQSKELMKKSILRKMKKFSRQVSGLSELEEDEENANKGVDKALRTFALDMFGAVDDCATRVGAFVSGEELDIHGDDDDMSVLTADSVGFDVGDMGFDWGDEPARPLTAAEEAELEHLKELLRDGDLGVDIGSVRNENFDRLKGKDFGDLDMVELTMLEHHLRYDDTGGEGEGEGEDGKLIDLSKNPGRAAEIRKEKMRVDMMRMLQQQSQAKLLDNYTFKELARYKTNTERDILRLRSFSAIRALKYYNDGGNFMDVLTVHRDIIDRIILAKGGWRAAFAEVRADTKKLDADTINDTAFWPEFFRIKVLEFYKSALQSQQKNFQIVMDESTQKAKDKTVQAQELVDIARAQTAAAVAELEQIKNSKKKPSRTKRTNTATTPSTAVSTAAPQGPLETLYSQATPPGSALSDANGQKRATGISPRPTSGEDGELLGMMVNALATPAARAYTPLPTADADIDTDRFGKQQQQQQQEGIKGTELSSLFAPSDEGSAGKFRLRGILEKGGFSLFSLYWW